MRKPKTARIKKKKGFKQEITLQEAFDVIAEELVRRGVDNCAFIGHLYEGDYDKTKIHLNTVEYGEESIVQSSKTITELKKDVQK
ncbi:hypothetical protein MOD24_17045 [Bacillus haynesii]|uniref:hypothetical protein n=1 Tax=Bacillus haynesii TaxID=1925021 RepID=UPI00228099CB|nr:hypothetical protein [Bacillus haynesii]MCY8577553.1 hypothetical protein [Bacillus haynesii]MEC1657100.1 hypothetical protein [Bacillus haynesii]